MRTRVTENEVFAVRDGETMTTSDSQPATGRWLAVMARSVQMPFGGRVLTRRSDGEPVEMAAILACQVNTDGLWQWVQLSPPTKEDLGDLMFDCNCELDRWYYVSFGERVKS